MKQDFSAWKGVKELLTVKESTQKAKAFMNGYKYLYGAKGENYSEALVNELAKRYPKNYTAAIKKEALKDANKGFKAGDCSFFVCAVLGLPMINSLAIKQRAVALFKPDKSKAIEGMVLWKNGHVAYIGDGLKVYEFKSTKEDAVVSSFESRAKDFTYMFVAYDSPLYYAQLNASLEEASIYYPAYKGAGTSIVGALALVGEKDVSFSHRKKIAAKNGVSGYEGTVKQNLYLVDLIKKGKLLKA